MRLGGCGAFWSLLKDGDIPKSIASLAIGVGVSDGASLLKPLHEGNQHKLESTRTSIDKAIDQNTQRVANRLTGIEEKYFLDQAKTCLLHRSTGVQQYDEIFGSALTDVYVPLELDIGALGAGFRSTKLLEESFDRRYEIWDLVNV